MKTARLSIPAAALAITGLIILVAVARAQSAAEFYRGKSIELDIGYSVGGGYDLYARLIARRLGQHVPGNPTVVPKNMEGAGSLRLVNYPYAGAARDGRVIGASYPCAGFHPLLNEPRLPFRAPGYFWKGTAHNQDVVGVCVALSSSGVSNCDDLFAKPPTIGSPGAGDHTYELAALVNPVLGTKFKLVPRYRGGNDVRVARQRGDAQGGPGWPQSGNKA